ncbi:DUF4126 domain-containing protein [Autumnicola psychrophila]|uniref:DUF4126 domain-containing protein n=1 Tax=Autumnicola psychrophila TaxID=3075592 RepID=A0ABU3DQP7_9FLAO|nr:DUF4126 domain-containing protein [Zunongwangia sp. F225]MDT0686041.1 DUF4126 domain-containing protein [Zunongwangia sp. F225]
MSIVQIITIIGSIPLFSLRTFLPAFLTALLLSYPEYFPGLEDVPPVPEDAFISRNWVLFVLGSLSLLEIIGDKSTEVRNLLKNLETYLKPISFLAINLSLLDESSVDVLQEVQWAAFDPLWILLAFGALFVHWLATLRKDFLDFLENIDEDDNLFIGKITSWIEDSLVLFGFLLLIWTGILMVILYATAITFFVFMRKRYNKKLEKQKLKCPACGESNLPFAVKCINCKELQPKIYAVGIFGQKKKNLIYNVQKHQLNLISHRKCTDCGNKLESTRLFQNCHFCGNAHFQSPTVKEFIKSQDKRFYKIAGLSFLLGFVPVIGFLTSAVMANIYLFSPYRRYIPKGTSFFTKVFIKFITFLFFIIGIALGFIAAPVYIVIRYYIWKKKFTSRASKSNIFPSSVKKV